MSWYDPMPASYPREEAANTRRRRAAFSKSFAGLACHHVSPVNLGLTAEHERRKTIRKDDSLRLIDDLTNHPMDPMFLDSSLSRHDETPLSVWSMRALCFVVCIAVGFLGCLFVQRLYSDPRKAVRSSLASELKESQNNVDELASQVADLHKQVESETKELSSNSLSETILNDEMFSGQIAVTGEGIELTMTNPLAAADDALGTSTRESTSVDRLRVVTDADLQAIVSLLWRSGAEAIAINDERLGAQTAIRTAGDTILVGLKAVESPYHIQAIGNRNDLAQVCSRTYLGTLYDEYRQAGITLQVKKMKSITLEAAVASDVTYARKAK